MSWGHELLPEPFLFTSHLRVQPSNANFCRTETDTIIKLSASTQQISSLCLFTFQHVRRPTQNILVVLFSNDNCCICDLLQSDLTLVKQRLHLCSVYLWQLPSVAPFPKFPVSSQSSMTVWILQENSDWCCCLFEGGLLIPCLLSMWATFEYYKVHTLV